MPYCEQAHSFRLIFAFLYHKIHTHTYTQTHWATYNNLLDEVWGGRGGGGRLCTTLLGAPVLPLLGVSFRVVQHKTSEWPLPQLDTLRLHRSRALEPPFFLKPGGGGDHDRNENITPPIDFFSFFHQ